MRVLIFMGLLVPSVLAGGGSCRAPPRPAKGHGGNFAGGPGASHIPNFGTHTWSRIAPSDVVASLHAIAQQSSGAVALLPGVAGLSGVAPQVTGPVGGYLTSSIQPPPGCTSLLQTPSTSVAASATGSGTYDTSTPTTGSGTFYISTPTSLSTSTYSISSATYTTSSPSFSGTTSIYSTSTSIPSASSSTSSSGISSSSSSSTSISSTSTPTSYSTSASGTSPTSSSSTSISSTSTSTSYSTSSTSTTRSSSSSTSSTHTSSSSTHTTSTPTSTECSNPTARVEWRNLTPSQQRALADANQCLMLAPPRSSLTGAKSRWDELVVVHQQMASTVHQVGQFLAWHRQFLWVYEQELRNHCQYTGPLAWWDETKDAGDYHSAPMMTSQLYGSAPVGNTQCITNGDYAGAILDIGPGSSDVPHCLSRGVDESLSSAVTNGFVNACNSYSDYAQMENCQFFGVHAYTHDAIGGVMSDITSSPGDPLFYLHHAFVDRNYRNWQLVDPHNRTYDIGGYTTQDCVNGGSGCTLTTLNDVLSTLGYQPDVTIAQVADTQGGHLCYYYDY